MQMSASRQRATHLLACQPANKNVTTMTYETKLEPTDEAVFVTPTMLASAVEEIRKETSVSALGFKNSYQVSLRVQSPREGAPDRKVSVKIFKNLRLHLTGTHSLDMAQHVVDLIQGWLSKHMVTLREIEEERKVDVVLYKYQLPGEVNMSTMQKVLMQNDILSIYDPATYAGIRAKFPLDQDKDASVMMFRMGKVIIIIPTQHDYDAALAKITGAIDSIVIRNWDQIRVKSTGKRDRED